MPRPDRAIQEAGPSGVTGRNHGLDMLRGAAILAVVVTHACWVFFPDFVIGNFHGLGLPPSIAPFPFYNIVIPNVFAVALLMAVSGYAVATASSRREASTPLPLSLAQRYLRLVLPALVAGLVAWLLAVTLGDLHHQASAQIYDYGGMTWLSWFWSDPPTFATLAREFLLGQVEQNSALLMQLWMMPDLFMGSVLCLVVLRFAPKARCPVLLLAVALPALAFLPLIGAVVLGAAIAVLRQAGRFGAPGPVLRCVFAVVALYVGLNPAGSHTGGMALEVWYAFWLPSAWAPWATALAGPVLLHALLPERLSPGRLGRGLATAGRNSYGLFLLHWPILLTLTCWLFLRFEPSLGLAAAALLALFVTLPVLVVGVWGFSRYVERPIVRALRAVEALISGRRPLA